MSRSHRLRGALKASGPPEALEEIRRELKAETARTYIERLVDEFPPLTELQRAKLAAVLLGARREGANAG